MKLKVCLFVLIALAPVFAFGQGCLTIFSEDGDKFYLVLNAVKQNPMPQTNVRVDGLTSDFYNAKIIFEDGAKGEITKNVPVKDAATGQFAEVTYKIKRTKDGDLKLRFFGATPVPVNYNPPPDMYVMHYGQPAPATTVTQTTVTTTAVDPNPGNGNISIGINAGGGHGGVGLNMNVNVNDPGMNNTVVQQTTTTRTTTTSSYDNGGYANEGPQQPARCQYPMDRNSFASAKQTVEKASFEDTKLSTAKTILSSNCFSTDQVIAICNLFSFEASKLDFAKFAYGKTTDPGNYFKVGNVFSFDASKTDLNNYISGH